MRRLNSAVAAASARHEHGTECRCVERALSGIHAPSLAPTAPERQIAASDARFLRLVGLQYPRVAANRGSQCIIPEVGQVANGVRWCALGGVVCAGGSGVRWTGWYAPDGVVCAGGRWCALEGGGFSPEIARCQPLVPGVRAPRWEEIVAMGGNLFEFLPPKRGISSELACTQGHTSHMRCFQDGSRCAGRHTVGGVLHSAQFHLSVGAARAATRGWRRQAARRLGQRQPVWPRLPLPR